MKKVKIIIIVLVLGISICQAQTKPRKKVIQTHQTIVKDSVIYLPDTIACWFKELVITKVGDIGDFQQIKENWVAGFVVWQTWGLQNYGILASYSFSGGTITSIGVNEDQPSENEYPFGKSIPGIFLYADKTKVTNQVIFSIKR